jgi:hypothetical protein
MHCLLTRLWNLPHADYSLTHGQYSTRLSIHYQAYTAGYALNGALRLRDGKAVSQLRGFRIYAAPLPSPSAWDTPNTGSPVPCRWASSLRAVICRRLLSSVLP